MRTNSRFQTLITFEIFFDTSCQKVRLGGTVFWTQLSNERCIEQKFVKSAQIEHVCVIFFKLQSASVLNT